jgi:hypothetical protein
MDNYFDSPKKTQTLIKHYILENCLKSSISISDVYINKFKNYEKVYQFFDLYAGAGKIKSSNGSPLIAINTLEQFDNKNISTTEAFFFEKNEDNFKLLENLLKDYKNNKKIKIEFENIEWKERINLYIKQGFGLIFADPYSNEDLLELEDISKSYYLKDILIFINIQSLSRLLGKGLNNPLNIENGITYNELPLKIHSIFKTWKKDFILFASIPTERKKKNSNNESIVVNSNYFGLILLTNSIGMADNFLKAYTDMITNLKITTPTLFNNLEENIEKIIKNKKELTLFDIVKQSQSDFLSWKTILNKEEIPTTKNIKNIINNQIKNNFITIETHPKFLTKKNLLKHDAFKANKNLKQIIIRINKF